MSDNTCADEGGEINEGAPNLTSITRFSDVSEYHDVIFDVLSVARCRYLIYYLLALDGNVAGFEAAVNAVYRYEAAGTEYDDAPRENIRVDLHHTQVPRLAEAGILEYDRRQGTLRFRGDPALEEWAEHVRSKELD